MDRSDRGKAKEEDTCVICLDTIASEKAYCLPCRHPYDYICVLNWLELRQACPLCKAPVGHLEVVKEGKTTRHPVEPSTTPTLATSGIGSSSTASARIRPRPRRPPPPQPEPVTEDIAVLRRRHVYRRRMRSLHVGSNRISQYSNFTPASFRTDEALQSRARAWIRRELKVFEWTNENTEFLIEYIIAILKSVELKAQSGAAEDMLADFLGRENAGIFCHELQAWLRSPFGRLVDWDNVVQYEERLPTEFDEYGFPIEPIRRKRRIDRQEYAGDRRLRNR